MQASGSTNQAIGMAHGWMTLTNSTPYSPGAVPSNTSRYIILFSDGLNTQDRWWGDGSTEGTTDDAKIDARENSVCTAAKADGVVIYHLIPCQFWRGRQFHAAAELRHRFHQILRPDLVQPRSPPPLPTSPSRSPTCA